MSGIPEDAHRLEALLPRLMRVLLPSSEEDPLGAIPLGQLRLLRVLGSGPRVASEVAAELGLSASALSQMVARLEESGYVHREDSPTDKRHRVLTLTSEAQARMARRSEIRVQRAQCALARLGDEERRQLLRHLEVMIGTEDRLANPIASLEAQGRSPY